MLKNLPIMLLSIAQKIAHYAQNYAHLKELCLKSDCSIRVIYLYQKLFNMVSVLLEYIMYVECSIRVITIMVSVLY